MHNKYIFVLYFSDKLFLGYIFNQGNANPDRWSGEDYTEEVW